MKLPLCRTAVERLPKQSAAVAQLNIGTAAYRFIATPVLLAAAAPLNHSALPPAQDPLQPEAMDSRKRPSRLTIS